MELQNFEITLDSEIYTALNRASREYDMAITDVYYFILNGGKVESTAFDSIFKDAVDAYYNYANKKDIVSNEYVLPSVREFYKLSDTDIINNKWSVNFDGSYICKISNITAEKNSQEEIYSVHAAEKWIDGINHNNSKMEIIDMIVSKLITAIDDNTANSVKEEYAKLRQMRIGCAIKKDEVQAQLMSEEVNGILKKFNANPEECTWTINPVTKTLSVIRDIK